MGNSHFNYVGVLIAVVAGIASAFLFAVLLGLAGGLFIGLLFPDWGGEFPAIVDGLITVLFVFPPYVICGYVAAHFGRDRKLLHSLVAGGICMIAMLAMALIPVDDPEPWGFGFYLYHFQILPLAIFGGWLNSRISE